MDKKKGTMKATRTYTNLWRCQHVQTPLETQPQTPTQMQPTLLHILIIPAPGACDSATANYIAGFSNLATRCEELATLDVTTGYRTRVLTVSDTCLPCRHRVATTPLWLTLMQWVDLQQRFLLGSSAQQQASSERRRGLAAAVHP